MHFGFALHLPDIDLWNIDLLDTHLDFSDTDITSKYVYLQDVLKTSSRYDFKTSSRRLQSNNFLSSKTSSRRLGGRKVVTLKMCWRRTNVCWVTTQQLLLSWDIKLLRWRCVEDKQMFAGLLPSNYFWVKT